MTKLPFLPSWKCPALMGVSCKSQIIKQRTMEEEEEVERLPRLGQRAPPQLLALHVKFSKCRSAPIMQGFRSASWCAFKFAELRRRDLQSLSLNGEPISLPLLLSVCGFKVSHFHLNWHELGSVAAGCRDQRQLLPKTSLLGYPIVGRISRSYFNIWQFCRMRNNSSWFAT